MVQLECLESDTGCPFMTQDLEFEQAEKILSLHMDRKHPTGQPTSATPTGTFASSAPVDGARGGGDRGGGGGGGGGGAVRRFAVKLSGMVWSATEEDIRTFLGDCSVKKVEILMTEEGRPTGDAMVDVETQDDVTKALRHDRQSLRERFVVVKEIKNAGGNGEKGDFFVKLSGLVWSATEEDLRKFFGDCQVTNIAIVMEQSGRPTGNAVVELKTQDDLTKALRHNKQYIGRRFVIIEEISEDTFRELSN